MATSLTAQARSLMQALSFEPLPVATLATMLKATPASVRYHLRPLEAAGLVVAVGPSNKRSYRQATLSESFEKVRESAPLPPLWFILDQSDAYVLRHSLDLFVRVGLGQFGELQESLLVFPAGKAAEQFWADLENCRVLAERLKYNLMGMSSGTSHSIHNRNLPEIFRSAWHLCRALRHRQGWDRTPEGAMSVDHDEPLGGVDSSKISVYSRPVTGVADQFQYVLMLEPEHLPAIHQALRLSRELEKGSVQHLVDMAAQGLLVPSGGGQATADMLANGQVIADAVTQVCAPWHQESGHSARSAQLDILLTATAEAKTEARQDFAADSWDASGTRLLPAQPRFSWFFGQSMPAGFHLAREGSQYVVLGPSFRDGKLSALGGSHSAQTSMQMARNLASGKRARSTGF